MNVENPIYRINRRLHKLGRSLKLVALGEGMVAFLITLTLVALVLLATGKLFYLPSEARITLLLLAAVALAISLALHVAPPLLRRISERKTAAIVEKVYPNLAGELLSSWELQKERGEGNYSAQLIDALTDEVSEHIDQVESKAIRDSRNLRRASLVLGAALIGLVVLFVVDLDSSLGALRVYAEGGGDSDFEISVSPGDARTPYGSDQAVSAVLSPQPRGRDLLPGKALIHYRFPSDVGDWHEDRMASASEGLYRYEFKKLQNTLEYYVSWREVRSKIFTIEVLEELIVSSMELKLTPPSYTGLDEVVQRNGDIKALLGTEVELRIWPNREVKNGKILFEDGTFFPLETRSEEDFVGRFVVSLDSTYRIELVDRDGYANEPAEYRIVVTPDNAPSVRLLSPDGDLTVSAADKVKLQVEAEDDYGLAKMELNYQVQDKTEVTLLIKNYMPHRRSVSETTDWDLGTLDLSPGDIVSYYIVVWDGDTVSGPKSARTRVYQLTIPTIRESLSAVQDDQEKQLQALGEIARSQQENRDETGEILNKLKSMRVGEELDWTESKKLESILERQESIREDALKLADAIRETLQNIEQEELRRAQEEENASLPPLERTEDSLEPDQEAEQLARRPEGELNQPEVAPSEDQVSQAQDQELNNDSGETNQDNSTQNQQTDQENPRLPLSSESPQENGDNAQDNPQDNQNRGEETPMSSPQIAEKMAEVQEMLERLSTREMQETIRRLLEANQENNLNQLRNQLEISEMSQEEFLQAMEQLLSLLERAYEEQKMLDLANFARRMLEEERSIRLTTRFFSGYDDLTSEQEEELSRLADRQERLATEDLNQLQKDMGEMKDPQLREALDKIAKWMEEQELGENMEGASKNLREGNLDNALSQERQAEDDLARLADALGQIYDDMTRNELDRLLAMIERTIRRSLYLSLTQENIFNDLSTIPRGRGGRERQLEMGELAERELELKPQLGFLRQEITNLVQGTPQVGMELLGRVSGATENLEGIVDDLEKNRSGSAEVKAKDVIYNLNQLIAKLLESQENLNQQQRSINLNQAMQRLGQLAQRQQGINQETGELTGELNEGGRRRELTQEGRERLRRLAQQQREVREGLEELARELGEDGARLLGDLKSLAQQMKKAEEELGAGSPSPDLTERQIEIYTRLLNMQKSLHRRDFEEKRQADAGEDYATQEVNPVSEEVRGSPLTELREDLLRTLEEGKFLPGYESLLESYFRALSEYSY